MVYKPSEEILRKYADVLVQFALNGGLGIKKGELVFLQVPECAKPLLIELQKSVLRSGAHYITQFLPDDASKHFFELASEEQLTFFPEKYLKAKVEEADHFLSIKADTNPKELAGIDPKKIMARQQSIKPYIEWRNEKENKGKMTWTLALYGTEAMSQEADLSLEEYWKQIIDACYLNDVDPIATWKKTSGEIERVKKKLDEMKIESLHVLSKNNDFTVGIGENRTWMGGSGRNIPSFELFISPDKRKTQGKVFFDQPLYQYGNIIRNVRLTFKDGKVIESSAEEGENVLKEMIASPGADMIGEFSLTDKRFSKINKFMADTLFDENFGGEFGNTHMALGRAYKDSYSGDPSTVSEALWEEMGYNESVVHTDIVSTENRTVTATLSDGSKKIIYKDGMFTL